MKESWNNLIYNFTIISLNEYIFETIENEISSAWTMLIIVKLDTRANELNMHICSLIKCKHSVENENFAWTLEYIV